MNKIAYFTCIFLVICTVTIPAAEREQIELVESIPVETMLDIDSLRNTPEVWQELIGLARKTLDIETFYFSQKEGEPLDAILNAIRNAAERGVQVRIISEARFHKTYPEPLNSLDGIENIEVRIIDFNDIAGGVMHAKYFIVDNVQVFVGSQNFDWRALKHIHELGIRIRSQQIAQVYTDLFNQDWDLAAKKGNGEVQFGTRNYDIPMNLELADRDVPIIPVFSPVSFLPDSNLWDLPYIVGLMEGAEKEINIQLLSYSPMDWNQGYFEVLDNAMREAGARGIKVNMIIADWSKRHPRIDHLKSLQLVPNIEVKLSTIPKYSGGFIPYARVDHCKYMVVDGARFWIGTSNWSENYFYNSRNAGFIIEDNESAGTVTSFFYNSWNSNYTYSVDPCEEYEPPHYQGEE